MNIPYAMRKAVVVSVAAAMTLGATGCANMDTTQRGTATGAGVGAGLGAILGATTGGGGGGRAAGGAVLGAAAGAVVGNIWSKRMESQKQAMEQATAGTGVQVSQTADNRLRMEIPSDISFDTNRADIKDNFRPILDRFATTLKENPATTVTIIGHTDSTGSDSVNQPLSVERASHTRDYLASRGVSPARVVVEGRGAREPIASNDDNSGRARNRRVEIYVAEPAPRS
ncbi:outer membrane protein OmpA-like peptidoglycan-associated protein [Massilia umbonata]|uniref:Outer membrane protein OmpA-like peptidoglycan-associated protein n=2 Tax=Pseudoduganella umbonata TaxID=864828 RepID=A0A7W5EF00_9BURK|nr:outer membrane protein OmpA-like peptidoglycan-associated protein [Pseudoduganella umbonata]